MSTEKPMIKPLPKKEPAPKNSLTFSDGLNFGCGFWVAGFLFSVIGVPIAVVIIMMVIAALGGLAGR